ncbi:MAG: Zn-ribbon domain-containing OB-fold protein [Dehalococcoidia bacterium]|nr:Zn-ribbon domain-containing OB-fold protein [Dehalococcoidia bacterium]
MKSKNVPEFIIRDIYLKIPYKWATGDYTGEFLTQIKESGQILGNRCPSCGRWSCPPRPICGVCHIKTEPREKWKALGPKGTVLGFCVTEQSFMVPNTGEMLEVPYSIAIILLDGAPVTLQHRLAESNPEKIKPGMRVEAVFKPKAERNGDIFDIVHFKTIS